VGKVGETKEPDMSENTVGVAGTAAAEIEIPVLPGEHMVVLIGTAHGEWSMPEPQIEQVTEPPAENRAHPLWPLPPFIAEELGITEDDVTEAVQQGQADFLAELPEVQS
jgi:hypothetical protein